MSNATRFKKIVNARFRALRTTLDRNKTIAQTAGILLSVAVPSPHAARQQAQRI
jgi:hypothetical protein